jgi:hypothetical protein
MHLPDMSSSDRRVDNIDTVTNFRIVEWTTVKQGEPPLIEFEL